MLSTRNLAKLTSRPPGGVCALCVEGPQSDACGTRSFRLPLRTPIRRMYLSLELLGYVHVLSALIQNPAPLLCYRFHPPKLHLSSSGTWTQSGEGRTERLACGSAFPPCSAHKGPEEIHAGPQARGWLLGHVAGRQNTVSSSFPQPALEIFTRNTSAFLPQMCSGFS